MFVTGLPGTPLDCWLQCVQIEYIYIEVHFLRYSMWFNTSRHQLDPSSDFSKCWSNRRFRIYRLGSCACELRQGAVAWKCSLRVFQFGGILGLVTFAWNFRVKPALDNCRLGSFALDLSVEVLRLEFPLEWHLCLQIPLWICRVETFVSVSQLLLKWSFRLRSVDS